MALIQPRQALPKEQTFQLQKQIRPHTSPLNAGLGQ